MEFPLGLLCDLQLLELELYKSGLGGRVVPTKTQGTPIAASADLPQGEIEPSTFFDEEAEQVKQKYLEEQKEEEITEMAMPDKPALLQFEEETKKKQVSFGDVVEVGDEQPQTPIEHHSPQGAQASSSSAAAAMPSTPMQVSVFSDDDGDVPSPTPRTTATTRAHGDDADDHEPKRARVESSKKQRIERVAEQDEMAIRVVKVSSEEELHTMDDYASDLQMDDQDEIDVWEGEDKVSLQQCLKSCGRITTLVSSLQNQLLKSIDLQIKLNYKGSCPWVFW